ncbi:GTP-binding protein TypA/BipA [Candidatus Annandia adelgestsuga]|uniref:50S ribosomal subunit assembly factor BipA n=1 Tax=Candidatus Annandia adelgestsuga TaxID=1302411 RepID=A0A3Q9CKN2_9ENTR|nr:translational GTPase TypA [Candidatus Annandia adelgestsuga]AZP36184.1 GTP-binding protein TypA/BipA [Candidatus Annandia adelgestsuga]
MNMNLRNIAIIAHVDHGKTTLVDKLLQQSNTFNKKDKIKERVMDSNILEKERGITILAKNTAIRWNNYHINIVDTPGHADFGGEVERVLSMVDSVLLVVDATDGPMPQTRFVTKKAFLHGLRPIVVINKIDLQSSRPDWVLNKIFDLFINLNATEFQLDFPVVYTSALNGTSGIYLNKISKNMNHLYESIIKYTPEPNLKKDGYFQMQVSQVYYNNYLGIIAIGRINRGIIKINQKVSIIDYKNKKKNIAKIEKIFIYLGLKQIEIKSAEAGNIVAISGLGDVKIFDTICDVKHLEPLSKLNIDKPTISMLFCVNNSPMSGKDGTKLTSSKILKRLKKETIHDISLNINETKKNGIFKVSGRGELHLSILIEKMRREGFELSVSKPEVIFVNINGKLKEPFEELLLDIEEKHQGIIMKIIGERKGVLQELIYDNKGRLNLIYILPSRNIIGFRNKFIQITSGTGLMSSSFIHYGDVYSNKNINKRKNGVLISNSTGKAVSFALFNLQERGDLFIKHGTEVYEGQIIGMHNRSNDLTVNCLTGKKLTNMRASGSDEAISLIPYINMNLEKSLDFIEHDELVEVTPNYIRLRKFYLKEKERKNFKKKNTI